MYALACPWHVWSLINFKWARGGHPNHNMTSVFVPLGSRVRILHIRHMTEPPVIWSLWSCLEKGPLQLYIPNHFVPLLRHSHLSCACEHVKWIKLYLHLMYFYLHFIFINISSWLHLMLEWFWSLLKLSTFQFSHNCLTNRII